MLLYSCSVFLVEKLYHHSNLPSENKTTYIYGIELFLSTFISCCSILLLSFLLEKIEIGVFFLLFFISLRLVTGGYHAKTYLRCFILSNFVFIICFFTINYLQKIDSLSICLAALSLSIFVIIKYSPIKNANHPLSEKQYSKNKRLSHYLILFETGIVLVLYFCFHSFLLLSSAAVSISAVAIMMVIPLFYKKKGGLENE